MPPLDGDLDPIAAQISTKLAVTMAALVSSTYRIVSGLAFLVGGSVIGPPPSDIAVLSKHSAIRTSANTFIHDLTLGSGRMRSHHLPCIGGAA